MLVDHHCHLDFPEFASDLSGVVSRAHQAGVGMMVTISTRIRKFDTIIKVADQFGSVYCSIGTHPHNADEERDIPIDALLDGAKQPKVVAIGEAGLDYYYKRSSPEAQVEGFRRHIDAARRTGLPLEIHTRDAEADTIAILEDEHKSGAFPAVLHCFTGTRELAMRAVDLGLYVSFSGVLTFKNSNALRAVAREVPMDRLLVETDAPFLAPAPHRGKTNEPAFTAHTAATLADVKGVSLDVIAKTTTDNFFRLYTKADRSKAGIAPA
jgi:TatD DNase family protein